MQTLLDQPVLTVPANSPRAYQGGYLQVLVAAAHTQGQFSLIDMTLSRGVEPPRHVHTREDETFYLLEGEITFYIGEEVVRARAGEAVFAPRQVPHYFTINTPQARFLTLITPGQFEDYFLQYSQPVAVPGPVTVPQGPPPADFIAAMLHQLQHQFGVHFLA